MSPTLCGGLGLGLIGCMLRIYCFETWSKLRLELGSYPLSSHYQLMLRWLIWDCENLISLVFLFFCHYYFKTKNSLFTETLITNNRVTYNICMKTIVQLLQGLEQLNEVEETNGMIQHCSKIVYSKI